MEPDRNWEAIDSSLLPAPWSLANLTAEETEKLEQFKEKVKDFLDPKLPVLLCLRWLRAREWDVEKAAEMFIAHVKWRKRMRVDDILEEYPNSPYYRVLAENFPASHTDPNLPYILRTRDGHHVVMERLGSISPDLAGLFPLEELVRFHVWGNEVAMKQRIDIMNELGGEHFSPSFAVEDLRGISLAHVKGPTVAVLKEFARVDSENYPEGLRKVIIIVPGIFNLIWKVVQYFFDARQKAKFEFLPAGTDYEPVLKQFLHPSYFPKFYGGNMDWDLPKAEATPEVKARIPKPEKKKWSKTHVSRGTKYEHVIEVEEVGTKLQWEFKTSSYDVGFGLGFKESHDSDSRPLVDTERVDSHKSPVHGIWVVEQTGHYSLTWDNSYSWTHGKDVKFNVTVTPPGSPAVPHTQKKSASEPTPKKKKEKK
eukprot:TRINITY_DN15389_c0_g1_i1.p1 TRINITY_DN15389_c0_g1~~TRINITY_DN15389_c0_g1_i1.p1  ORF type:complete len:424 (+),score=94.08 TRINITY_DN15389_c0_g1_i1:22-1293(+)